jgi:hypothetical protein
MNELMERLARANPVPPGEPPTAEERREAEALLERILTDSPTVSAPKRVSTLRRVAPAAGVLAVVALAAVIVIDLLDSEERGSGIVERAVAAVSRENVIWAITERQTITAKALEPGIDTTPGERTFARSWYWSEGERSRMLWYRVLPSGGPGRLHGEAVSTPERIVWFDAKGNKELAADWDDWNEDPREGPPADSAYPGFDPVQNPGAQLREHVEQDRLRVAGRTTVRGRTAYRLVSSPIPDPDSSRDRTTVTYLVDARTYLPLEVRQRSVIDSSDVPGGGRERLAARIEYLRYEALPVTDENKRLLEKGGGRRP